jgi:hypothetical protein
MVMAKAVSALLLATIAMASTGNDLTGHSKYPATVLPTATRRTTAPSTPAADGFQEAVVETGSAAVKQAEVLKAASAANAPVDSILQGAKAEAAALEEAVSKGVTKAEMSEVAEGAEVEAASHSADAEAVAKAEEAGGGVVVHVHDHALSGSADCACLTNLSMHAGEPVCVYNGTAGVYDRNGACFPSNYGLGRCAAWDDDFDSACANAEKGHKPSYCDKPFCYVDQANCDRENRMGTMFPGLAFSYDTCDYINELIPEHPELADLGIEAEAEILNSTARAGENPQDVADAFEEEVHAMESFVEAGGNAEEVAQVAEAEALAVEEVANNPATDANSLSAAARAESETIEKVAMIGESPGDIVEAVREESQAIHLAEPSELEHIADEVEEEKEEIVEAIAEEGELAKTEADVFVAAAAADVTAEAILQGAKAEEAAMEEAVLKGVTTDQIEGVAGGDEAEAASHSAEAASLKHGNHGTPVGSDGCKCLTNVSAHAGIAPCMFNGTLGRLNTQGVCFPSNYGIGHCTAWDDVIDLACLSAAEGKKPSYCEQPWCYVDHANCDRDNRVGTYFDHVAYSYDTCDYATELTPAHPELADKGIAAEMQILNSSTRAGNNPQVVADAFEEEVKAMESFVEMGGNAEEIAEVAEQEAEAVGVIAEEGLGPHALTNAAKAESETIEKFALTGDSPEEVVQAVKQETALVELATTSELRGIASDSEAAKNEIEGGVADTGRASVETAKAISQAAAYGAPVEMIVAGAEAEAAALAEAFKTGVTPADVGDSRLTILTSALRAGESEELVAATFQEQAEAVKTFAAMGATSQDMADVATIEAETMEYIAAAKGTGPHMLTHAAEAMAHALEAGSLSDKSPAEAIIAVKAEAAKARLAKPHEFAGLAHLAEDVLEAAKADIKPTPPTPAPAPGAPAAAAPGGDLTALIMSLPAPQQAVIGSMSPAQQQQFFAAPPSAQLSTAGFSLPPTPAAPTPAPSTPAPAAPGGDLTALIMSLPAPQQAVIGSMSPAQQQQFFSAPPSAQLSSMGFSLPPTPAAAPAVPAVPAALAAPAAPAAPGDDDLTALVESLPASPRASQQAVIGSMSPAQQQQFFAAPQSAHMSTAGFSLPPTPVAAPTPAPPTAAPPPAEGIDDSGGSYSYASYSYVALSPSEAIGEKETPAELADEIAEDHKLATISNRTFESAESEEAHESTAPAEISGYLHELWQIRSLPSSQRERVSHMSAAELQKFIKSTPEVQVATVGFSMPPSPAPTPESTPLDVAALQAMAVKADMSGEADMSGTGRRVVVIIGTATLVMVAAAFVGIFIVFRARVVGYDSGDCQQVIGYADQSRKNSRVRGWLPGSSHALPAAASIDEITQRALTTQILVPIKIGTGVL